MNLRWSENWADLGIVPSQRKDIAVALQVGGVPLRKFGENTLKHSLQERTRLQKIEAVCSFPGPMHFEALPQPCCDGSKLPFRQTNYFLLIEICRAHPQSSPMISNIGTPLPNGVIVDEANKLVDLEFTVWITRAIQGWHFEKR